MTIECCCVSCSISVSELLSSKRCFTSESFSWFLDQTVCKMILKQNLQSPETQISDSEVFLFLSSAMNQVTHLLVTRFIWWRSEGAWPQVGNQWTKLSVSDVFKPALPGATTTTLQQQNTADTSMTQDQWSDPRSVTAQWSTFTVML